MHRLVSLLLAGAVLAPAMAAAQMQPHRAEYALSLGLGPNPARIGTATQDLALDCSSGWHLKRSIRTEIALTTSWKMTLSSKLDAEESRSGTGFRYSAVQIQNGSERETRGKVQRQGGELRAEIVQPGNSPNLFVLPPPTFMPIAAVNHLIERLQAKATSFPALMFDAEVAGDVFLIDVAEQEVAQMRAARRTDKSLAMPSGKSWPVHMTFTRGRQQDQRPLFTVAAQVFDTGVLDRLTVDTGLVTVTADLLALEMRPIPNCPRS